MAFPTNCNPRIINVDASTGCTLTRASIIGMTPTTFEAQGFTEVKMDMVIQRAKEARVAGVIENTLEDLLMSRMANIKGSLMKAQIGASESVILPYIYRRQRQNINSNYWNVVTGAATPGAGQGGLHPGAWDLTVGLTSSPFASALVSLEQYFLPQKNVQVEYINTTTNVLYNPMMQILASVNANSGATQRAKITVIPPYTVSGWNALSAAAKLVYQPTAGLVIVMANAISDYESWCYQDNAENTNKLLTFFLQTTREVHQYSDEYLLALNAALTSGYFKDFRELPLAQQKVIQHKKFVRDWMNSVFYGQAINEFQDPNTYTQLPTVVDPLNPSCTLEYKANALGCRTQLSNCGRVLDMQGAALNLNNGSSGLFQAGYLLKRAREASGGTVDTIDWMTDRFTAGIILQVMQDYYKKKYGVDTTRFYQPNQKLMFVDQVMATYNLYQLPPDDGGYNFAVFTDPFFDDKLISFAAAQQNAGRVMWGIDWTDFQLGIAGTNSATRQTNVAADLYNCIIRPNVRHFQHNSTTWTTILEDVNRHLIVQNFAAGCPTITVAGCSVGS